MEGLLLVTVALLGGLSTFVLVGGMDVFVGTRRSILLSKLQARARKGVAALSRRRVVRWLLGKRAWGTLAAEVAAVTGGTPGGSLSAEEVAALYLVALGCAGLLGLFLSRSVVGALALAGCCVIAVPLVQGARERGRKRELADEMPGIFRTLAVALGSGQTLTQAIEYVGTHERGPAANGFARASLKLRCGVPADDALSDLSRELDAPGIGLIVTALLISQRTGSPLGDLFQRSAKLVEQQGEFERTLSVKTAQVRLSVKIVCLLPLLLVAVLSLISPDFQQGLGTVPGTVSVLVALLMDGTALLIIRRLLQGVI